MNPSIFNDVIGPVMRGPSSSHTAASWRIARMCLEILDDSPKKALIEFDKDGAWATNYEEQGTVMGITAGLLGLEITDDRMKVCNQILKETELTINYQISSFKTQHVNTVRILLEGIGGSKIIVLAASLGGGSFKIYQLNDLDVDMRGDYFEMLIFCKPETKLQNTIEKILSESNRIICSTSKNSRLIIIKSSEDISKEIINKIKHLPAVEKFVLVNPILPIISGIETKIPFDSIETLLEFAEKKNMNLGDIGIIYEKCRSGLSRKALRSKMNDTIKLINHSIKTGLAGTNFKDRILGQQSHLIEEAEKTGKIPPGTTLNRIIANVSAIMEVKSAMELFVANPTAGSCGTIGGVLQAISKEVDASENDLIQAYFAAGIIGVYFALGPGFSAEEHGCQVECGAASGMAAAAIVQLYGGSASQALDAASLAIQNMIGLICDPVADRVEIPCLGKNINAAVNAYASATMVRAGYNAVIPLDEVIETVGRVGRQMPSCVKCSGTGGLAITQTAIELKAKMSL